MVAAGRLRAQLEALQFIEVFAEGRIAVMIAATAHDMGSVGFMMHGGLGAVRLGQVEVGVGPRDDRMRGDGATAETGALDWGGGAIRHGGKAHKGHRGVIS
jgi:hypothetical protein